MCMLCVEWEKQRITSKEAFGAMREMILIGSSAQVAHLQELSERILEQEIPPSESNPELDKVWSDQQTED